MGLSPERPAQNLLCCGKHQGMVGLPCPVAVSTTAATRLIDVENRYLLCVVLGDWPDPSIDQHQGE